MDNKKDQCNLLFVYGTLMRGMENPFARKLGKEAALIADAWAIGKLYLIDWYPGMIPQALDKNNFVFGELYAMKDPDNLLAELDEYEDFDHQHPENCEYVRTKVTLGVGTRFGAVEAWTYVYNWSIDGKKQILSGRFRKTKYAQPAQVSARRNERIAQEEQRRKEALLKNF